MTVSSWDLGRQSKSLTLLEVQIRRVGRDWETIAVTRSQTSGFQALNIWVNGQNPQSYERDEFGLPIHRFVSFTTSPYQASRSPAPVLPPRFR